MIVPDWSGTIATNSNGHAVSNIPNGDLFGSIEIQGSIAEGSTVTLIPKTGGFGSFDGEIVQFLRGDEGANGDPIHGSTATISKVATRGTILDFGDDPTGEHLVYSTEGARDGRTSSLRKYGNGLTDGIARAGGFGYVSSRHDKFLYISYWRRFVADDPDTWYHPEGINLKQYYVFSNGGDNETPQALLMCPNGKGSPWSFYDNVGPYISSNNKGWNNPDQPVWERWESRIRMNDIGSANGLAELIKNCEVGISDTAMKWQQDGHSPAADGWDDFRLGHMHRGAHNTIIDFSDVYVSTTDARIEIGNAPTWSSCTHREQIVVPEANWSDQAITGVVLDKGSLAGLKENYLYVVKSNGLPFDERGQVI